MTSILLIIVGIALAAAAALMAFFYGGDAFETGAVTAHANTLENAAGSVIAAARLYYVEKSGLPDDMGALVTSAYLAQKPELGGVGVQSNAWRRLGTDADGNGGRLAYVVDDIPGEVCLAILHLHHQDDTAIPSGPTTSPSGCFQASSATDAVFYAYLPSQDESPISQGPEEPVDQGRPAPPVEQPEDGSADKAAAAEVRSVGTIVASAARGYAMAHGRPPMSDADLSPDYVTSIPRSAHAAAGASSYMKTPAAYRLNVHDGAVCLAINVATGIGPTIPVMPSSPAEGCYQDEAGGLSYVRPY